jgi:membrane fusion protein, heavy metal efflux system
MRFNRQIILVGAACAVTTLVIATGIYFTKNSDTPAKSGFGPKQADAAQGQAPYAQSPNQASSDPLTVTLEDTQLKSIMVEPVAKHLFWIDCEAVGSVDFAEDLSIVQAESALIGAAGTFEVTSKELARATSLYAANVGVSQKELDQAVSDQQTAEGALKAARDAVRVLGKTDAEIDQMIALRKIEPFLAGRMVVANVAESDTPLLHVGQPVIIRAMAYPGRVFEGRVSKIYSVVDPNTHKTKFRVKVADTGNELRPGMLASVEVQVQSPTEAVAVPVNSVVREGDGTMTVWVTTDRHQFVQKTVKLGLQKDGWYQIAEGLKSGELVVAEGGIFLSNMLNAPPTD